MTTHNDEFPDHDAAASNLWTPKPTGTAISGSKGVDHTQSFARSTMREGEVASTQSGGVSRSSYDQVVHEQNVAANVPWTRAVDHMGNHIAPDAVKDDTRITLPVYGEMTLGQAKAAGFIQARGQQRTEDTNRPFEKPQAEAPKAETHPDLDGQPFADPAVENNFNELVNNVAGTEQVEAVRGLVENGEIDEQTLGRAASQLRIEPGSLQERIAPIMKAYETQAREVMGQGGVSADDVIAYGQTHARDALNRAMHRQASKRSTGGYAELRKSYLHNLATHYPERALAADLGPNAKAYKDEKGGIRVSINGVGEMSWESAIKGFANL